MINPTAHPDCLHPLSNMDDDYAGVTCCLCDGNPCSAVTPVLVLAHDTFTASLWGEAS